MICTTDRHLTVCLHGKTTGLSSRHENTIFIAIVYISLLITNGNTLPRDYRIIASVSYK